MNQFAKISRGIWWHPEFRQLPPIAKLLFIHFFSHPRISWCGLLQYPWKAVPTDLGITPQAFRLALKALVKSGMVIIDSTYDLVFVVKLLKWHPPRSSKDVKGIINILSTMPPTCLQADIWEIVENHLERSSLAVQKALPIFKESKDEALLASNVEPNQNQNGTKPEPNRIRIQKKEERRKKKEYAHSHFGSGFDQFWINYPRKVAKQKAWEAWVKLEPDEELTGLIVSDLEKRTNGDDWREVKFIPYPATYLNQRRWEDEVTSKADKWKQLEGKQA